MKKYSIFLFIISFLVGCSSSPTSTPTTGQVEGVIVDSSTSQPIADLNLQLLMGASADETGISFSFGETMPHATTNSSGEFRFTNLESSSYAIAIDSPAGPIPIISDGNPIIVEVSAGQVIDLGTITVAQDG